MAKKNMNKATTRKANNPVDVENILKDIRGQYGNLSQIIMELVDNSASNFEYIGANGHHIQITITRAKKGLVHVVVRDDGDGIENLDKALSIGNKEGAQTASNDHGHGFKNLPVLNIYLRTTHNGKSYYVEGPFVEGVEIQECEVFEDLPHGTEFTFDVAEEYLQAATARWGEDAGAGNCSKFFSLIECVVEDIGMVHGHRMDSLGYTITVEAYDGVERQVYPVQSILPNIKPFNVMAAELNTTKKTIGSKKIPAFNGEGEITLEYCIGENIDDRGGRKRYYAKQLTSQGFYILLNGRYIGKTANLSGVKTIHPSQNGFMGVVNIVAKTAAQAPHTAVAKTGFIKSHVEYNRLVNELFELCPNIDQILNREVGKRLTERAFVKAFAEKLEQEGHIVETDLQTPGTKDKIDMVDITSKILYEMKLKSAKSQDPYQILRYINAYRYENNGRMPFKKAYLCATDLPSEAAVALRHVNQTLSDMGMKISVEFKNVYTVGGQLLADMVEAQG